MQTSTGSCGRKSALSFKSEGPPYPALDCLAPMMERFGLLMGMGMGIRCSHYSPRVDRAARRQGVQEAEFAWSGTLPPEFMLFGVQNTLLVVGNLIPRTSFPQHETVPLARPLFFQASCRLRLGPRNRIGLSVRSQPNPRWRGRGNSPKSHPLRCFASLLLCEWQSSLANEDAGRAGA